LLFAPFFAPIATDICETSRDVITQELSSVVLCIAFSSPFYRLFQKGDDFHTAMSHATLLKLLCVITYQADIHASVISYRLGSSYFSGCFLETARDSI
jgi:hypothetical protein